MINNKIRWCLAVLMFLAGMGSIFAGGKKEEQEPSSDIQVEEGTETAAPRR